MRRAAALVPGVVARLELGLVAGWALEQRRKWELLSALVRVRVRESAQPQRGQWQRRLQLRRRICGVRRGLWRGYALWRARVKQGPQPAERIQAPQRGVIRRPALARQPLWRTCVPWAFWWLLWA